MYEKLRNMKKDSVLRVFDTVIDKRNTTRTVLHEETGLSFVTVSKICDELINSMILRQSFSNKYSFIERRSRLLSVRQSHWIGVYVIHPNKFTFSILDLTGKCKKEFIDYPRSTLSTREKLTDFLSHAEGFIKRNAKIKNCIGFGILTPGDYDPESDRVADSIIPDFDKILIKETFSQYTFGIDLTVKSLFSAFAEEAKHHITVNDHTLVIFLNKGSLYTAYITPDNNTKIHVKNLAPFWIRGDTSFSHLIQSVPEPETLFHGLASVVFTLLHTVQLSNVIITGYLYKHTDSVPLVLKKYIIDLCIPQQMKVPNVSTADLDSTAHRNITREIGRQWFLNTVLETTED